MPWKEWSLIINSLMIQLATGMLLFFAIFRALVGGDHDAIAMTASGLAFVGPLIVLGMVISIFHLGHPLRAYRATFNLQKSWLSREVFFTTAFFALWLGAYLLEIAGASSELLIWTAAVTGLMCVLSMVRLYTATGIRGWHGLNTYVGFFGTVIVPGSVGGCLIVLTSGQSGTDLNGVLLAVLMVGLVIQMLRFGYQITTIKRMSQSGEHWRLDRLVAAESALFPKEQIVELYNALMLGAGVISLAGILLVFYLLVMETSSFFLWGLIASGVLATGEILGRAAFYSLWQESVPKSSHQQSDRDEYGKYQDRSIYNP